MKVSSALALAAASAAVTASPMQRRAVGGVLLCTGPNSTGECRHDVVELDTCHQLRAPFYRNTSTFAPDGEAFTCSPRLTDCGAVCTSPTGCTFGAVSYASPRKNDLAAIRWNTLIASFDCTRNRTRA